MGSDLLDRRRMWHRTCISIHAPAWGATVRCCVLSRCRAISIHAPAWGATSSPGFLARNSLFQSTLPHGERRTPHDAPTRTRQVFQSTLPHGERQRQPMSTHTNEIFQSTLPHGERLGVAGFGFDPGAISIHAPAWGATCTGARRGRPGTHFNPRSRMGSDDPSHRAVDPGFHHFNPRSRMGSDFDRDGGRGSIVISIHAPAWGATTRHHSNGKDGSNFNPRSRMGSDRVILGSSALNLGFQSTLPHGERP